MDRVKILRDAYAKALGDPELIAEAQKGGWVIEPVSGEELQSLAERIMVQPSRGGESGKEDFKGQIDTGKKKALFRPKNRVGANYESNFGTAERAWTCSPRIASSSIYAEFIRR